jgi:hypothetical protein
MYHTYYRAKKGGEAMGRTLTMDEAKARPLEELLREVAERGETLRIVLDENDEVEIKLTPHLKPLITFEGYVPDGWKDAIYEPKR